MEPGIWQCQVLGHERLAHRSRPEGELPGHKTTDYADRGKVFGPNAGDNPVEYYVNPVGIQSIVFSAAELGPSVTPFLSDDEQADKE